MAGVLFKIFDEHPHLFYINILPGPVCIPDKKEYYHWTRCVTRLKNFKRNLWELGEALVYWPNAIPYGLVPLFSNHIMPNIFLGGWDSFMVGALNSRASGLGLSPGWRHCVVFLGKTPSQCFSPAWHINGYQQNKCWGSLHMAAEPAVHAAVKT